MTDDTTDIEATPDQEQTSDTPEVTQAEAPAETEQGTDDTPETFSRSYVEGLRQENGKYRQRAQQADELAHRLHRALVEQSGRLQDASDLAFDETHLADENALTSAIDQLLTAKPHLTRRQIRGEIGQGATSSAASVDLAALLRGQR